MTGYNSPVIINGKTYLYDPAIARFVNSENVYKQGNDKSNEDGTHLRLLSAPQQQYKLPLVYGEEQGSISSCTQPHNVPIYYATPKSQKEYEQQLLVNQQIDKYIQMFEIVYDQIIYSKKYFKQEYLQLWQQYVQVEWLGVYNGTICFDADIKDEDAEPEEGSIYDLRIRKWLYQSNNIEVELIDINAWPGDNEDGAIFLNGKIIIVNGDCNLIANEDCPMELTDKLFVLEHLRNLGSDDTCNHEECYRVGNFADIYRQKLS